MNLMSEDEAIKALEGFFQIADALEEDVRLACEQRKKEENEYSKRVLVKTIFAFLEGHLFAFKQVVLGFEYILNPWNDLIPGARASRMVLFSEEERAMLEEFTFDLSGGGKARKLRYYPRFEDNMKFVVQIFHRAIQRQNSIDFNSHGWSQLMKAQSIRNRITHPKTSESLKITDEEMQTVIDGHNWYTETINSMLANLRSSSLGSRLCQAAARKSN